MENNVAEYRLVLRIKPGMEAPSIKAIGAAMEVGTEDAPEEMGFEAIEQIVVDEPREDLTEALHRAEEQCKALGARTEQLASALRAFMDLYITAGVGPDGVVVNPAEDWYDAYVAAAEKGQAALNTAPQAGPQFMVQWENAARAEFYALRDIVDANAEGDPELCEWCRKSEVGESYRNGGGASPLVTTWRIA